MLKEIPSVSVNPAQRFRDQNIIEQLGLSLKNTEPWVGSVHKKGLGDAPLDLMPQNTEEIQCKTSGLWQTPGRSAIHRSNKHLLTLSCQTADFTIYPKRLQEKKRIAPQMVPGKATESQLATNSKPSFLFPGIFGLL